jgi:hypothetical protein
VDIDTKFVDTAYGIKKKWVSNLSQIHDRSIIAYKTGFLAHPTFFLVFFSNFQIEMRISSISDSIKLF